MPASANLGTADSAETGGDVAPCRKRKPDPAEPRSRAVPFASAEEAWLWCAGEAAQLASGAHWRPRRDQPPRPCQPADLVRLVDRQRRTRTLERDHLFVLRHYGRRGFAPDPYAPREKHAHRLWTEALARLAPELRKAGVVREQG